MFRTRTLIIALLMMMSAFIPFTIMEGDAVDVIDDTIIINDGMMDEEKEKKAMDLMSNYFIENEGQISEMDHYFYSTSGDVHFLSDGVLMRFRELTPVEEEVENDDPLMDPMHEEPPSEFHDKGVVLKYTFENAKDVIPVGRNRCSWDTNYFKGPDESYWFTEVANYREIVYEDVWDGIDVVYRLKDGNVKYDIVISPGADPSQIQFGIEGCEDLSIDENEGLVISTAYWDIMDTGLVAFYEDNDQGQVQVGFEIKDTNSIGFDIGNYDQRRTLVIDPLTYSTYIGGSSHDYGWDIAVDSSGNAYVTGQTNDDTTDYPTTSGAYDTTHNGGSDVFVTKLNSTGSSLTYSTFLGGGSTDYGNDIAVDSSGNAYVTGVTYYDTTNYPTTSGAYDTTHNTFSDVFVTKLNSAGSSLTYSTFIGGNGNDYGYDIAVDSSGNAYVTGYTKEFTVDYPTTSGAYDTTHNGGSDVFVTKLNSAGSSLTYSTFIGGDNYDYGYGIAIDSSGNAYVTGYTYDDTTTTVDYPTTSGAYDTTHNGGYYDVFVTKLNSAGSSLTYSTFIGGKGNDYGHGIAVDSSGNAYVTGNTYYDTTDYPTTSGAYDTTHNGGNDVFVTKLNSAGSSLTYSTLIGGSGSDYGYGIAIDSSGNAYVTGVTYDATSDYPTTSGAYDTTHNGGFDDVFVTKLNSTGSSLTYSTFIGGDDFDYGQGITIDSSGNAYVTGRTFDDTTDYPTTSGAYDTTHNGNQDVFVTKLPMTSDSSKPTFGSDNSDTNGTTGDQFVFNVSITDDVGVTGAYVEYWYGNETHSNVSMSGSDGNFTKTITIPSNSTSQLHYIFHAKDAAGSWNQTNQTDVNVTDNDGPTFGPDASDTSGTTGESFSLNITVEDNIELGNVYAEYWYGSGSHTNSSMSGTGPYTLTLTVPSDSTDSLHYYFHSNDAQGNWNQTDQVNITISDNDSPVLGTDSTPSTGTTGDSFTFNISVTDNIGVTGVYVEYWYGSGSHTNSSMSGSGPYTLTVTLPSDSTDTLHYIFHASDSAGNWEETSQSDVTISDNDGPVFGTDGSDTAGTTGESFDFSIAVTDNIGVNGVYVEYWFGTGSHTNTSMSGTGPYTHSISVPSDSDDDLHYIFHATDSAGNWEETSQSDVTISDNDAPVFGTDGSDTTGTTGDSFTFNIAVTDNIGVTGVYVEYWYGSGSHTNSSMSGTGPYTLTVTLPSGSTDSLHYIFHATDSAGNWDETSQSDVTISDNDAPVFGTDSTPSTGTTGDSFTFNITVTDNIGVTRVYVEYWYGSGSHTNTSMSGTGPYTLTVTIPSGATDSLHYIFHAADSAGNWEETSQSDVTISDNDAPVFGTDGSDTTGTTGESFDLSIAVTDNIGVTGVYVEYWFNSGTHTNSSMSGTGPYTLTITVASDAQSLHYIFHATDSAGNWEETSQSDVTISDNDAPVFGTDSTPSGGTTGDSFTFNISVTDNIGVTGVYVEYWYGSGSHTNTSMSGSGPYTLTVTIPSGSTDSLHYIFHAADSAGNWAENSQVDVTITDNDAPVFGTDGSDTTSTTGESFDLSIAVSDNIGVTGVYVEYWFNSGTHTNSSMSGTGPYTLTITVASDAQSLHYIFHATDSAGNWDETSQSDVTISDNDKPVFGTDSTPSGGTTGDSFTFNISVTDNIGVTGVYVEYWYGTGSHTNTSMSGSGPYTLTVTIPSGSTDNLHYIFHAADSAGNWEETSQSDVTISDNDAPVFGTDGSDTTGTTGESFDLSIAVTDNIGVTGVYVEYWFNSGTHTNSSMSGTGPYTLTITVASDAQSLHYIFHATDSAGNWEETSQKDVTISDNDKPVFGIDGSDTSGTTGETFDLNISVSDNIEVSVVHAEYWFNTGSHFNMTMDGSEPYYLMIDVPSDAISFHYMFHCVDTSENWEATAQVDVQIADNDDPAMIEHLSNSSCTTGDQLQFIVNVTDNIGIDHVNVTYTITGSDPVELELNLEEGLYQISIDIPNDNDGDITYSFTIFDTSMNTNTSEQFVTDILDDEDPVISIDAPDTVYHYEPFMLNGSSSTDNIGVVEYIWNLSGTIVEGVVIEHMFEEAGVYNISLTIHDAAGNNVSGFFLLTVLIKDTDGDGVPDHFEDLDGTDPEDPKDFKDTDGDGVPDHVEIEDGTDPDDADDFKDTDDGGVPDYVEEVLFLTYGLNATDPDDPDDDLRDTDGDGVPDYIEILEGTDPEDPDDYKDTDGDGVPDYVEKKDGTDPEDPDDPVDTDGDWVPDYVEEKNGTDPDDPYDYRDTDDDQVPDYVEKNNETDPEDPEDYKDTDGDGVPDYVEIRDGTDPEDPEDYKDTDGDGVPDYVENKDGTDPEDPESFKDTDGDGVPDYVEKKDGTDPEEPESFKDTDGDGVPDYVEKKDGTDPEDPESFKDTDDDGVPDYVEKKDDTDPEDPDDYKDTDDDGVPDYVEKKDGTDPDDPESFKDTDDDGVPDYVEKKDGTDPEDPESFKDTDDDGVPDYVEKKDGTDPDDPESFKDTDDDGVPDYVEKKDGTDPEDPESFKDTDDDGVPDYVEKKDGTDPEDPESFKDTDDDGVPDYVEKKDGTDPEDPESFKDTDDDGVPDYVEKKDGTDPEDPESFKDTDDDGVPDYVEKKDGTDPEDPESFKDTDDDGVPDYVEIIEGTDPSDPDDFQDIDGDGTSDYEEIMKGTDPEVSDASDDQGGLFLIIISATIVAILVLLFLVLFIRKKSDDGEKEE